MVVELLDGGLQRVPGIAVSDLGEFLPTSKSWIELKAQGYAAGALTRQLKDGKSPEEAKSFASEQAELIKSDPFFNIADVFVTASDVEFSSRVRNLLDVVRYEAHGAVMREQYYAQDHATDDRLIGAAASRVNNGEHGLVLFRRKSSYTSHEEEVQDRNLEIRVLQGFGLLEEGQSLGDSNKPSEWDKRNIDTSKVIYRSYPKLRYGESTPVYFQRRDSNVSGVLITATPFEVNAFLTNEAAGQLLQTPQDAKIV